jgi:hypothetical protein
MMDKSYEDVKISSKLLKRYGWWEDIEDYNFHFIWSISTVFDFKSK